MSKKSLPEQRHHGKGKGASLIYLCLILSYPLLTVSASQKIRQQYMACGETDYVIGAEAADSTKSSSGKSKSAY